jgi:hypothetical protein
MPAKVASKKGQFKIGELESEHVSAKYKGRVIFTSRVDVTRQTTLDDVKEFVEKYKSRVVKMDKDALVSVGVKYHDGGSVQSSSFYPAIGDVDISAPYEHQDQEGQVEYFYVNVAGFI